MLAVNSFMVIPAQAGDESCRTYSFTVSGSTRLKAELCQEWSDSVQKYMGNLKWRTNSNSPLTVSYSAKCTGRVDGKGRTSVDPGNQWTSAAGLGGCVDGWNDVEVRKIK